jgi:DNA-binding CsgD family transcriptional regulator
MLIGREAEIAVINGLLARAREGTSGALAICGEPGIGKTALLAHAAEQAADFTVLRVLGVESEAELPYAALHQLVHPLLGHLAELPPPQSRALEGAFGMAGSEPPDRFAIGVALMTLLADAADEQPLLCLLDDVQWFDNESTAVLGFAARRLQEESVVLLFGVLDEDVVRARVSTALVPGVEELRIARLAPRQARDLLASELAAELGAEEARVLSDEVLAHADGNPLALLELAARSPISAPFELGHVRSYAERTYLERIEALPEVSRTALLVAALADAADLAAVDAAARLLGSHVPALEAAELAGLIRIDGTGIEFRHPLVRSAAQAAATFHARQEAHRALAAVLADDEHADRRAWHLAAATVGIDEDVAEELARAAERARQRGGYTAAAIALERAAERTGDPDRRQSRLVDAAEMAWSGSAFERAIELLDRAEPIERAPLAARTASIRASVAVVRGETTRALELHLTVARTMASFAPPAALGAARLALEAAALGGHFDRANEIRDIVRACERTGEASDEAARSFVEGLAAMFLGDLAQAAPALARTVELGAPETTVRDLSAAAAAASYLGRADEADALFAETVAHTRATNSVGMLALMLQYQAMVEFWNGRLADAQADALEALALARETEQVGVEGVVLAILAGIAAMRGEEEHCRDLAATSLAIALPRGLELAVSATSYALGLLELGLGNPATAFDHLDVMVRRPTSHPIYRLMAVPDLVEAAARMGEVEAAHGALEAFREWGQLASSPWTMSLLARATALVASEEDASAQFEHALELHDLVPSPLSRARTELLYGEHLRRRYHRMDARPHLRSARDAFESLGAAPWAQRATAELRATGETAQKRAQVASAELTPQELQVARLVGAGATNREVASQLFVSPKTVEYHLGKVFRKLEIVSRTDLVRLTERRYTYAGSADQDPPAEPAAGN